MSETLKVVDKDKPHFITTTVTVWLKVFEEPTFANTIIQSLQFCQREKGLEIFAYCLMPDHLHMIARAPDLPAAMRDFKKFTAKLITSKLEETEHKMKWLHQFEKDGKRLKRIEKYKFWRDGFHPIELGNNDIIKQKMIYIHNNPVKAGIVKNQEDYWYSSARNYAELDYPLEVILIPEALR